MFRPDVIKVILADDHFNGREAIALAERLSPHVAVLDFDMPQMDGSLRLGLLKTV